MEEQGEASRMVYSRCLHQQLSQIIAVLGLLSEDMEHEIKLQHVPEEHAGYWLEILRWLRALLHKQIEELPHP